MASHRESRIVALPPESLFDVVADVESYPDFVPLMRDARIVRRDASGYETVQTLALGLFAHRFQTRTELVRPKQISVVSSDRSFCRFDIRWTFVPHGEDHCRVDFAFNCLARSLFLIPFVETMMLPMAATMVGAFESQAHRLARRSVDRES